MITYEQPLAQPSTLVLAPSDRARSAVDVDQFQSASMETGRALALDGTALMARTIECTSEIGTTVGLIDAIITLTRLLDGRLDYQAMIIGAYGDKYQPIRNALRDLLDNSPYRKIIEGRDDEAMKIIHDAAEMLRVPRQ